LAIKFHVVNINLYNSALKKTVLSRGFDLIKSNLVPRLQDFSYDLKGPLRQIENLILAAATPNVADRVKVALSTLRPLSAVVPVDNGLKLALELTVPEVATPQSTSVAPLSPTEVAAWQTMLDDWDAFIVFAVKQLAGTVEDKQVRDQLFTLLLDSRYRLVEALRQPQPSTGPDPIRLLFIDEWTRLNAIIQSAAHHGMLGSRVLEFLSFVTAGDALFAADQAAPALGMHISEDDLRRLARVMAPEYAADPLLFSYETDPELQNLFGVTEPLESHGLLEEPVAAEPPTPSPSASPTITLTAPDRLPSVQSSPATVATPSQSPASSYTSSPQAPSTGKPRLRSMPTPGPRISPTARLRTWLSWICPADANASEEPLATQILSVGAALRRVVVEDANASAYSTAVLRLLTLITQRETVAQNLNPRYRQIYLTLMKSTAWQESCWRQFIRVHGQVRFLESNTGDIGLMQINKQVWRGFYSIPRLEWDIVYNTGAGAEILLRLMSSAVANADTDNRDPTMGIARSTYAAYNGGPDAYHRWRRSNESAQLRDIDRSFWSKFRAIEAGQLFDIMSCAAQWSHPSATAKGPQAPSAGSSL
jgi:hypothetical protein